VRDENALAEQVEVGAAVHGAFECLDAVDLCFDGAGAVGQSESGGDCGVVAAANRAPGRPARATAMVCNCRRSATLARARRAVRPGTCSTKVRCTHSGATHTNCRTCR
jgi:hypothetical protein